MNKEEAPRKCRNKPKNGGADEHQLAIDTEFLEAVADLQIAKVKQMLDAGQVNNGNVGNEDGLSSVHIAVKAIAHRKQPQEDMKLLDMLIENGAFADYPDNYGRRPINMGIDSAYHGAIVVDYLLKLVDKDGHRIVDLINYVHPITGRTVLHDTAWAGNNAVMEMILNIKEGGEPVIKPILEAMDHKGKTCVMIAAFRSTKHMVELLNKAGADLSATEQNTRSLEKQGAMEMAERMGRQDTADYLKSLRVTTKAIGFAAKMKKAGKGEDEHIDYPVPAS